MRSAPAVSISFGMLLLFPATASAAGFATQSIFLSQSSVREGDPVQVYAVVANETQNAFSGSLRFSDEAGVIGTKAISLAAGQATTAAVPWTPKAGEHTITVDLENDRNALIASQKAVFAIGAAPEATTTPAATSADFTVPEEPPLLFASSTMESSAPVEQLIAQLSPRVASATAPAFLGADIGRRIAGQALSRGSEWAQHSIEHAAGAPQGVFNTLWLIGATVALYVLGALLYSIGHIGIFYPALVLLFFYLLWRTYRFARR